GGREGAHRGRCAPQGLAWAEGQTGPQDDVHRSDGSPQVRLIPFRSTLLASAGRVDGSVRTLQQPPRNHLCLYLGCTLEDVEDAGITENARDGIFEREPVAAMDLHGIIGGGPGDACGKQLGHACLEIAAPALIFLPGSVIGELTGDHDLDGHHYDFVPDAWKRVNRAA